MPSHKVQHTTLTPTVRAADITLYHSVQDCASRVDDEMPGDTRLTESPLHAFCNRPPAWPSLVQRVTRQATAGLGSSLALEPGLGTKSSTAGQRRVCGICVGSVQDCMTHLKSLSSGARRITALITHAPQNDVELHVRHFADMDHLKSGFHSQGSLELQPSRDGRLKGRTCAVEALANVGLSVEQRSFSVAFDMAHGERTAADTQAVCEAASLDASTGGNDVPAWQMMQAMRDATGWQVDESQNKWMEGEEDNVYCSSFWTGRRFAIFHLPVCSGHWVSLERITYTALRVEAYALREGRGRWAYDHITHPVDGGPHCFHC